MLSSVLNNSIAIQVNIQLVFSYLIELVEKKHLNPEKEFALKEGLLLNSYFILKRLGQSDEIAFDLDKNDAAVEQGPLIYQPINKISLKRNETFTKVGISLSGKFFKLMIQNEFK